MVVLDRYVSPSAGLESYIAQHLSLCERNIPEIVPGQGEIRSIAAQFRIAGGFLSVLFDKSHVIHGGGGVK